MFDLFDPYTSEVYGCYFNSYRYYFNYI